MGEHHEAMLGFAKTLGHGATYQEFETFGFAIVYNMGTVVVIGHSDGYGIGSTDARQAAEVVLDFVGTGSIHQVFLCACDAAAGTFAQEMRDRLGGICEVWASTVKAHGWATGPNGEYSIVTHGGDVSDFHRIG